MPNENGISDGDMSHFHGLLVQHGFSPSDHTGGSLNVKAGDSLTVQHGSPTGGTHLSLETNDFHQAKKWLGVPDAIYDEEPFGLQGPADAIPPSKSFNDLTEQEQHTLKVAANHFLNGDSRTVDHHKPALERLFAPFAVKVYVYDTLDVSGTLTYTDPAVLILANTVVFHPNGVLKATSGGQITIKATNMENAPS